MCSPSSLTCSGSSSTTGCSGPSPPLADRLTAERERRSRPGARPWIHRYTRLRESEALVRTLTGHTDG